MKIISTLILFFSIISINAFSQEAYGTGYVVTTNNDTIEGSFLKDLRLKNIGKVYFKDQNGNTKYYEKGSLNCYVKGAYIFLPRTVRTLYGKTFGYLKLQEDGVVKVLVAGGADSHMGVSTQIVYFLERGDDLVKVREMGQGYFAQMKKYFADEPEVVEKIKSRE